MSAKALIQQRAGNKSGEDLERAKLIAMAHPGWTATQIAWAAAGFSVDDTGHCQPAGLFRQCLDFFNVKRRVSERAFDDVEIGEHPRAAFRYGTAICNPYEFGGQGVYPLDYVKPVANKGYVPASKPVMASAGMPDSLRDLAAGL